MNLKDDKAYFGDAANFAELEDIITPAAQDLLDTADSPHSPAALTSEEEPQDLGLFNSENRTFTYFTRLPLELRWKIWGIVAAFPQLISVGDILRHRVLNYHLSLVAPVCPVLRCCQEARREALKTRVDLNKIYQGTKLYADLNVDTIYVRSYSQDEMQQYTWTSERPSNCFRLDRPDTRILRRLAFSYKFWNVPILDPGHSVSIDILVLVRFPRLEWVLW